MNTELQQTGRFRSFFQQQWANIAIVFTFIGAHLLGLPIQLLLFRFFSARETDAMLIFSNTVAYSMLLINVIASIVIAIIIWKKKDFWNVFSREKWGIVPSIIVGFGGFLLAMIGQAVAAAIEINVFGVEPGSQNTEQLSQISSIAPLMIVSIVIFAPLIEELVFRRAIFGGMLTWTNSFWISAIVSGVLFAVVHRELEHTLMYMMPALAFAFVYYISRNLLAPIAAHFFMNGTVVLLQLNLDKLQPLIDQAPGVIRFWIEQLS